MWSERVSDAFEYDVFLSHASADKAAVGELAERLKGDGLLVWLDEWVIQPGDSIPLAIEQGLESSRTLVLVMSTAAFDSEWVTLERHTALFRDPTNKKRRFIPLRLDGVNIPDALRQYAYVDWRTRAEEQYARLLTMCRADGDATSADQQERRVDRYPYSGFSDSFRDVVAPVTYSASSSVLNVVFGNLADIQRTVIVVPVNQAYDLEQRGPTSVLASFERICVAGHRFYDAIDRVWPRPGRPTSAAIGDCRLIGLGENSQGLQGVLFAVTTRNLSTSSRDYGRYVNTPVAGIDYVVEKIIDAANEHNIESLALPLLGTGYANTNIGRTFTNPHARELLRSIILCILIARFESELESSASSLRRAVIVIHSDMPNSPKEHLLWERSLRFLKLSKNDRETELRRLLQEVEQGSELAIENPEPQATTSVVTAANAKTARIELKIDGEFEAFKDADQDRLLRAIKELLQISGDIRVTDKRDGSVFLTLELDRNKAEELAQAVKAGKLAQLNVVSAKVDAPEVSRLREGDQGALEELFRAYHETILRSLQRLFHRGSFPDAEDIALATFMRFHEMVSKDRLPTRVMSNEDVLRLLMMIARRAVDMRRASMRRKRADTLDVPADLLDAEASSVGRHHEELMEMVREVIASLPAAQRQVIELRLEGHTLAEIAERLGCSASRVARLSAKATSVIQERLSDDPQ